MTTIFKEGYLKKESAHLRRKRRRWMVFDETQVIFIQNTAKKH